MSGSEAVSESESGAVSESEDNDFYIPSSQKKNTPKYPELVKDIQRNINNMVETADDPTSSQFRVQCLCKRCVNPTDVKRLIDQLCKVAFVYDEDNFPRYDGHGHKIEYHVNENSVHEESFIVYSPK